MASLPGLQVVPAGAAPPPSVAVWAGRWLSVQGLSPETKVLQLTTDTGTLQLAPGVSGVFSQDERPENLAIAIRQVARGEQYFSPAVVAGLLKQLSDKVPAPVDLTPLTERERETLALLGAGLSNKAIAARLYLSVRTVEGHLAHLYARLGVHSRTEAVLIAVRHGLGSTR